jgi:malonate transporter
VKTLVRNPLISAPLLGILFSTLALSLPKAVSNFLELMAAATGPGALFALGLSLVGRKLTGNAVEIAWLVVLKLVVQPIITFVLVAYAFGMDPYGHVPTLAREDQLQNTFATKSRIARYDDV